jgi:malate dehydrogenase
LISIIGSGKVGSAIAFLAASRSLDDIVLVNRTKNKAIGEALDLTNSIPKGSSIFIKGTDDFAETKDSEVIVIAASAGTYSASRNELIKDQVTMVKQIVEKLKPFSDNSKILMVSNPLDVLTYVFQKEANLSSEKVIGIASSLDSSRFQYLLSRELSENPSKISDALVIGEHGDSMVPIFSRAKKDQTPVLELLNSEQIDSIIGDLRFYWKTLREYKSRSVFGISKHVFDVLEAIIKNKEIAIPSSVLLSGQYGLSDVCLGVPTIISKHGLKEIQEIELTSSELESLNKSSEYVKSNIHQDFK